MVRICIISTHSFHQTALLLLLGVSLCSHLSYVPPHLTQISLHHPQLCSVLCNHMQKYPFVLVWFVFFSRKSQCLSCPMVTFILQPSEPGLLARAARTAGAGNPLQIQGVVAVKEKREKESLCPPGRLGSCCIFPLLRADRLLLRDGNC